jgi:hypothetical protein
MVSRAGELGYGHRDIAALFQALKRTVTTPAGADDVHGRHALPPVGEGPAAA